MIITSNLSFTDWKEGFHVPLLTVVLTDRFTHKSYVLNMSGSSYRIQKTKEGLELQHRQAVQN
ncbi:hypothetical protein GCM10012290_21030 [Halolactibacillus alkaliphilus]|uniref:IstB-like ATP-binding domain-containing protein n=1 Tax=Halolactibacillus alkaliphilus TaxID=442899 RepID=A0A511X471_9BACI|nr:ATP-binding protein [Halolactibacillus alkaliphilus]GEN57748.1 hypothetical protein HAL01_22120 [Halolactibacillus alkaliphilus]GGN73811.1 hypothetical protein GCM10012290_21030 [Halolactibacillus alkaliphilus]